MKPLSSRLKLALLSAGISGLVLVASGAFAWLAVYNLRIQSIDREIRSVASRHPGLLAGRGSFERLAASLAFTFGEDHTNRVIIAIQDRAGRFQFQSANWPESLALLRNETTSAAAAPKASAAEQAAPQETESRPRGGRGGGFGMGRGGPPPPVEFTGPGRFYTERAGHAAWRMGVLTSETAALTIGLRQDELLGEMNRVRNIFLLILPVALVAIAGSGWVIAGRALRPLAAIADTAERVTARGLDQRIPEVSASPEARRVIQVLNRMMDRLQSSFQQATRFSADASHELKTPLAIMQGELENALQAAAPGSPDQQVFTNLLENTQRLATVLRSLLLLAQADAGQLKLSHEPVDLGKLVGELVEDARALAGDTRLEFECQVEPGIVVRADRALLQAALLNLLVNAVKYNEPGGRVAVSLGGPDGVRLTVGNTGPGIAPADRAKVFDRFYRVRPAARPDTQGLGLGLSLAREIVSAHGGELELKETRPGWTCFEVRLRTEPL